MTFDPRTVSLGEAAVALGGSEDPFGSNPAGLASVGGAWLAYDRRGAEWTKDLGLDDFRYRSWAAGVRTPWGTVSFAYRRQDIGTFAVTTLESPSGVGEEKTYNHAYGIAWGYSASTWLDLGVSAKTYTDVMTVVNAQQTGLHDLETTQPILFDAGLLLHCGSVWGRGRTSDDFSFGISLQNFGTDYRIKSLLANPDGTRPEEYVPLPRVLRLGFGYHLSLYGAQTNDGSILQVRVLGEYRRVLNTLAIDDEYYWGWGTEFTAFDLLSLRLGGYFQPFQSVYGNERDIAIRMGAGLRLPLRLLGDDMPPLAFAIDYAAIPLNNNIEATFFGTAAGTANVFSVKVQYEADLFGGAQ